MSFLWFLLALIFFILWLRERSDDNNSSSSAPNDAYGQGYWDGYRSFGDKLSQMLERGEIDEEALARTIEEGNGAEARTPRHEHMAGIIPENTDKYKGSVASERTTTIVASQPIMTEAEIKAAKEKRTLQNLNTILYVGSFLIVAAAALFVTLVMPAVVKLLSLIFVTGAFYVSGFTLHTRSERLRPAALAFVGTGLAILPFVGFALNSLGGLSGASAWFITSMVGLGAYGLAAVRLKSQLVSYLTMAFVISLAMSAVSTLSLSIVWYFIVVIGVSLVCNSIHIIWPKAVPKVFAQPIEQTGQIATPIALLASLSMLGTMDLFMYEILFAIATAHYLVLWLEQRSWFYEVSVRVLAHVTLALVAYDAAGSVASTSEALRYYFGLAVLVLSILQIVYSLVRVSVRDRRSLGIEQGFVMSALGIILCGMLFWIELEHAAWLASTSLAVIGVGAFSATLRFRAANWAYIALIVSLVLPFMLGRSAIRPEISYEILAGGFVIASLFALMALERAQSLARSPAVISMLTTAVGSYASLVALTGYFSASGVTIAWTSLLTAGILGILSYLRRYVAYEVVGAIFGVIAMAALVYESSTSASWQLLVILTASSVLLSATAAVHHARGESRRRDCLVILAAVLGAGLVCVTESMMGVVVARTATALLLMAAVAATVLRYQLRERTSTLAIVSQVAYFAYSFLGLISALSLGGGWLVLALVVASGLVWVASYLERAPWLMLIGNILLVVAIHVLWDWLKLGSTWQLHGVVWLSAAVFYLMHWYLVQRKDEWRQWTALGSMWVVLGLSVLAGIFSWDDPEVLAGVGSLLAIAVTLGVQGYRVGNKTLIEMAVYLATFSTQRLVSLLVPETNLVAYGHWWALTIALVAYWYRTNYKVRLMVGLGFVTGSTGLYALMGEPGYSLLFLVEHVVIVVAGAMLRQQWAMWWGIVATVVAILYFLREFTFLALLFLGFLLIVFVIWRLTKVEKK